MIGLDTNVLVRYLVQDDPNQSKLATKFIEENCSDENTGYKMKQRRELNRLIEDPKD